jgi:hypothetical protein
MRVSLNLRREVAGALFRFEVNYLKLPQRELRSYMNRSAIKINITAFRALKSCDCSFQSRKLLAGPFSSSAMTRQLVRAAVSPSTPAYKLPRIVIPTPSPNSSNLCEIPENLSYNVSRPDNATSVMAPTYTAANRGRPKGSKNTPKPRASRPPASSNPFASSDEEHRPNPSSDEEDDNGAPPKSKRASRAGEEAGVDEPEKTIPNELLTRLLHEFFAKDATRMSKDANAAVGKYMDIFVREAIARTAVEKQGGFLEVSL